MSNRNFSDTNSNFEWNANENENLNENAFRTAAKRNLFEVSRIPSEIIIFTLIGHLCWKGDRELNYNIWSTSYICGCVRKYWKHIWKTKRKKNWEFFQPQYFDNKLLVPALLKWLVGFVRCSEASTSRTHIFFFNAFWYNYMNVSNFIINYTSSNVFFLFFTYCFLHLSTNFFSLFSVFSSNFIFYFLPLSRLSNKLIKSFFFMNE